MTPIEVICRQLCVARGGDPDAMIPGHLQPLFGMTMADDLGPNGEVLMRRWRTFVAEADAMLLALDRAGYGLVRV